MTKKPKNITPGSITIPTFVTSSPITVKVTQFEKEPLEIDYDPTTPSSEIVKHSLNASDIDLGEVYVEKITETVEISRGLIDGGFKFALKLPEKLGGGGLELERLPQSTKKTTKRIIYKPPNK
jgi:hypothetical protein